MQQPKHFSSRTECRFLTLSAILTTSRDMPTSHALPLLRSPEPGCMATFHFILRFPLASKNPSFLSSPLIWLVPPWAADLCQGNLYSLPQYPHFQQGEQGQTWMPLKVGIGSPAQLLTHTGLSHSIGLPGACLTIGKDGGIEAFKESLQEGLHTGLVHGLLPSIFC